MRQKNKICGWRQRFPCLFLLTPLVVLLILVLGVLVSIGVKTNFAQDNPPVHSENNREFLPGSPEAVVGALMEFDFMGGERQTPETFPEWFPLTTGGEPDSYKGSPYWGCKESPVVDSYKILGVEPLDQNNVRVLVEVKMVGMYLFKHQLQNIDQCYWPEISTNVIDQRTGEVFKLEHPLNGADFLRLISGKEIGEVFPPNSDSEKTSKFIVVLNDRSIWRHKVDLVKINGRWLIKSSLLPYSYIGLETIIESHRKYISQAQEDIEICSGKGEPPKDNKERRCLPREEQEKKMRNLLDKLKLLESIQGGAK